MEMLFLTVLSLGIFGSPSNSSDESSWQFSLGKQIYRQGDFWEIGVNRYRCRNNLFYRIGGEIQYQHNKSENLVEMNQMVRYLQVSVNSKGFYVTKYWNDYHFRIKPTFEYGYKMIQKKKYSSDFSLCTGIGFNLYRNFEHHYYLLDSNLYPINELIIESGTYDEYSFLRRPEFFFALQNAHYFKINTKNDLFFDYMIGFSFGIYKYSKYNFNNGLCLQLRVGYSFIS